MSLLTNLEEVTYDPLNETYLGGHSLQDHRRHLASFAEAAQHEAALAAKSMTTGTKIAGSTSGPLYYEKTWSGSDDPLKRAQNPWSATFVSWKRSKSKLCPYPAYPAQYFASCSSSLAKCPTFGPNDELKLLNKLIDKARGHSFDAGVFVGTSHELASSVVRTTTALAQTSIALKRGDLEGATRLLVRLLPGVIPGATSSPKLLRSGNGTIAWIRDSARNRLKAGDISGAWLAWSYGYKPVLQDIQAAAEAFEVFTQKPITLEFKVGRRVTATYEGSVSPSNWSCPGKAWTQKVYHVRMNQAMSFAQVLGLTDIASVAWEVTPWSFAVDWALPIGSYLRALGTIPELNASVYYTLRQRSECRASAPKNSLYCASGFEWSGYEEKYTRSGYVTLTVPRPRFVNYDRIFSSGERIANAVALAQQVIAGSLRKTGSAR